MKPRVDVRPYIADSDYVIQLSNDMETYCYTINEALEYGVPVITTPLTVMNEFNLTDDMHITLDWNCENVDEVARLIFEKEIKPFKYNPPESNWEDFLVKEKSNYEEERTMKYKVRATEAYQENDVLDTALGIIPKKGHEFIVDKERLDVLLGNNEQKLVYVEIIEERKEELVEEKIVEKKTTKRTTKKVEKK